MKQVLLEKGAVTLHDIPAPHVGAHEVLVVVYYAFIDSGSHRTVEHGTFDPTFVEKVKHAFDIIGTTSRTHRDDASHKHYRHSLHVLGTSCAGQVIAVGSHVQHIGVGDWVACASAEYALHAELVSVPEHLVAVLHSKKYIRAASISAIGARSLHALRRAHVQFGEWVAVIGLGLLGQLTVQLARLHGCKVIAIDVIPNRREIAKKIGAHRVYDAEDPHIIQHIVRTTRNAGVDAAIITASSQSNTVINQAAMITRKRGSIVVAGNVNMECDRNIMVDKELDVLLATSYGPGRYNPEYEQHSLDYPYAYVRWTAQRNLQAFVNTLEHDMLYVDDLITHEYELSEIETAYEQVMRKTTVGIILTYRYEDTLRSHQPRTINLSPAIRANNDALRIGILGISNATKHHLLPALSQLTNTRIATLIDTDNVHAYQTGREYDADYVGTDPSELLTNKYIEIIAIDNTQYVQDKYVFNQLEHGIGIFLHTMPWLNTHELHKWRTYAQRYTSIPLCVNLHKSFSRHIHNIATAFQDRNSPLVATYRMIPPECHATSLSITAIVNHMAHVIDMFMTLTQSPIRSCAAVPLHSPQYHINQANNCVAYFTCEDGSTCSFVLTSVGSQDGGSEYIEVFCDGATATLTDFTYLRTYGGIRIGNQTYHDDGYARLIHQFFGTFGSADFEPPIPFDRIVNIAEIAMAASHQLYASSHHIDAYTSAYTPLQQ